MACSGHTAPHGPGNPARPPPPIHPPSHAPTLCRKQVDPAEGWGDALRGAGRLLQGVRSERRRWPGASPAGLSCEVLHLPAATVAALKVG